MANYNFQDFEMTFGSEPTPPLTLHHDTASSSILEGQTVPTLNNIREQTITIDEADTSQSRPTREVAQSRREKNRVSLNFLKRPTNDGANRKVNGHPHHSSEDDTSGQAQGQPRSTSGNRKSLVVKPENEITRSESRESSVGGRSTSSHRPPAGSSNFEILTSSVESVKKRLSILRMGRKNSKAGVRVDILQEE